MDEILWHVEWLVWRMPLRLATQRLRHFRRMLGSVRGNARALVSWNIYWTTPASFLGVYLQLFMAEQGLTKIEIGTIASAQIVTQMACALVAGYLADRLGRLRTITFVDVAFWPAAYLIFSLAHGYLAFLAGAILVGGVFLLMPAWAAMYVEGTPPARRPHLYGVLQIAWFAGGILSALTGLLVKVWGVTFTCRVVFGFSALLTAFSVWQRGKRLRETEPRRKPLKPSLDEVHALIEGHWAAFLTLISRRQLAVIFLIQVLTAMALAVSATYTNLYLADARGAALAPASLALLPLIGGVMVILATFLLVPFISPAATFGFMLAGVGLMASNVVTQLLAPSGALMVIVGGVMAGSAGFALYNPSLNGYWQNLISDRERPRVLAFCTVVSMLVTIPAPTIAGAFYTIHPRGALLMLLGIYALIALCVAWAAGRSGSRSR